MIEIDITNTSLSRFSIYARIGVPESWHHDGERVTIFDLLGEEYAQVAESAVLPPLAGPTLSRFVEKSRSLGSVAWIRNVREWAQSSAETSG